MNGLRPALRQERWEWSEIPPERRLGMRFIDSHLHLSEYPDPRKVIMTAHGCDTLLYSAGVDESSSMTTLRLADSYPAALVPFVGIHPSEAGKSEDLEWVPDALAKAAGAGEIGLDPKYAASSPMKRQVSVFERQISAAERLGKPVQVHSRGAERECLDVLSSSRVGPVLLHWFQGDALLGEVRDRGYFVSFGPAMILSGKLQRMAASVDPHRILVETDGPVGFAALGGASGPSLIPSAVFSLAQVWNTGFQDARELVLENSLAYVGSRTKG